MEKCQIQWINRDGNSTPDENDAVAKVRCTHKELSRLTGKPHEPSESFFICPDHLATMFMSCYPDWEVTEILVTPKTIRAIKDIKEHYNAQ